MIRGREKTHLRFSRRILRFLLSISLFTRTPKLYTYNKKSHFSCHLSKNPSIDQQQIEIDRQNRQSRRIPQL